MPASILATKLNFPPQRAKIVNRQHLLDRLNAGMHCKLTLVSAPAGFGKTTLLGEWVSAYEGSAAWLSLDEGDNDAVRFWSHFISALQGIVAEIGTIPLSALQASPLPSIESILESLLNEIALTSDEFILVLDDYHRVDSSLVDDTLAFLIERQPPQMHLVIITREDPDLPVARLRASDQLIELRAKDLRFSESESAEFLNQVMGLSISPENIAALEARTEGWIVGLQLAALSMQGIQDTTGFIRTFKGSHHYVLDYLIEEVLQNQAEEIQNFLLQTSILDRMCGQLCDAVLLHSSGSGQGMLQRLEHANLFVIPIDQERKWYRYHQLFRDLLNQRFNQKWNAEEISKAHLRASEWLEANGETAEAFRHSLAASDLERALRLVESAWEEMNESFQMSTWLGWANQLPLSLRRKSPVLCVQMGSAYMDMGNFEASESSLRDAEYSLNLPREQWIIGDVEQLESLPARIAYIRAYNSQAQLRFSDVIRFAEMALELSPENDDFMRVQVSTLLMGTHWAKGDLDASCKLISDWVDASIQAGKLFFAIAGSFGKADILSSQGRLREVKQTYQKALEIAATHHAEEFTAHHHLGLGMLYHETGEDELAVQHLQKGYELGRSNTIIDWPYRKAIAQAILKESEGSLDEALDLLDEAQHCYVRTPTPNLRPVEALQTCIYLKQGDILKAREWVKSSGLSLQDEPDYLREFERLTMVRVALAEFQNNPVEQRWQELFGLLERQLALAEHQDRLRSRIEILILQALAFYAKGEKIKAVKQLTHALEHAEVEGFLRIFAAEGKPMMELLSELEDWHLKIYARKIMAIFMSSVKNSGSTSTDLQKTIESLSERELEVLRLIAQGLSNQEISRNLFISLSTVKGHNLRIFSKLMAKSRTESVARARELGLI